MPKITNEKGHFLDDNEKMVKQTIMDSIMRSIFDTIIDNQDKFKDAQSVLDILFSVLVMTNREVLVRIIFGSQSQTHTKRILKNFFSTVSDEVHRTLIEYEKTLEEIKVKDLKNAH